MSEFVQYLSEVFQGFGPIRTRRMFGGHGVYRNGTMFGLVVDDVLYLKAGAGSSERYTALGLTPFVYLRNGKPVSLSYYQAPEEIYDDPETANEWARHAYEAALASKQPRRKRKT